MNIIIGLIGMLAGALITIYSEKMLNAFGRIPVFEKYLGTEGGSRLGYKIIGMLIFFIFVLVLTGSYKGFMLWVLSPIMGLGK